MSFSRLNKPISISSKFSYDIFVFDKLRWFVDDKDSEDVRDLSDLLDFRS